MCLLGIVYFFSGFFLANPVDGSKGLFRNLRSSVGRLWVFFGHFRLQGILMNGFLCMDAELMVMKLYDLVFLGMCESCWLLVKTDHTGTSLGMKTITLTGKSTLHFGLFRRFLLCLRGARV